MLPPSRRTSAVPPLAPVQPPPCSPGPVLPPAPLAHLRPAPAGSERVARALSLVAHPLSLVLMLAATAGVRRVAPGQAVAGLALVAGALVLPLALYLRHQVRRGRWTDADASRPEDRPALLHTGLLLLPGLCVALALAGAPPPLLRGTAASAALLLAARALLPWVKASLHLAFAALTLATLVLVGAPWAWAALPLLPALAWARWRLGRHTLRELAVGTALGLCTGAALALA